MARSILRSSFSPKTLLLLVCLTGALCVQVPLARAQHVGGHPVGAGPRTFVPPPSRGPVSRPVFAPSPYVGQFGVGGFRYRPGPFRPFPPFFPFPGYPFYFGGPFWFLGGWGYNPCWWLNCYLYWNWGYSYNPTPWNSYSMQNYVQPQVYQYSLYAYGSGSRDFPQLCLKDGTVISVSDYWLADNEVHFIAVEGAKSAEQTIPLDELDLQATIDANTRRGFRFVLRDEPMDQYLRDHPNESPPDWPAPKP
jgi:hypothetical protein